MRALTVFLLLVALPGCVTAPVQVRSAPQPTAAQLLHHKAVQMRVLDVPVGAVFPRVIDVLMDNGYVILFASKDLGVVSFHQQWKDTSQQGANIIQEGSAVFRPASETSVQVRVFLTGGWQRREPIGVTVGDTAMMSGVEQTVSDQEYERILDIIQQGLVSTLK